VRAALGWADCGAPVRTAPPAFALHAHAAAGIGA